MTDQRARDLSDLLEPTLAGARPARPPYSVRAQLIVAFFGGIFGAVAICTASSRRIGSLASDLWFLVAAVLGGALWIVGAVAYPELLQPLGTRTVRYGQQLLGFAVVGGFYLKHRAIYKAVWISGDDETPSPWGAGVGAVVAGAVLSAAMFWLGRALDV